MGELEDRQRSFDEMNDAARKKEALLEQRVDEYSQSLQQAQQEAQQGKEKNKKLQKDFEHQCRQRKLFEEQLKEFKALENAAIQELNQKIANLTSNNGDPTGDKLI